MNNTELLENVVLNVLEEWDKKENGWWFGYTKLMIDVKDKLSKEIQLHQIKQALIELRKKGKIIVNPIFKEGNGLLNGSGYFYKK